MTTTAAVLGVTSPVGRAVLARLAVDDRVDELIAIGPDGPDMPPGRVEVRTMDARDRLLPLALEGVDVLVHCAFEEDPLVSADSLYGSNVGGTRNVLEAVSKADVGHVVVISDAMVYGAHDDNPLPLTEDAPMRANPGCAYAYQRQLVEEMVAEHATSHPTTIVTRLRTAPLMGTSVRSSVARRLQAPRLVVPTGLGAPWQFVHVDDVARAVQLVVDQRIGGVFNVAADGWLSAQEVATYIGRRVIEVPQTTLVELMEAAARAQLSPMPPDAMPYLLDPWVVDNARLRAHGWQPTRSNREMLTAFSEAHHDDLALGRFTFSRNGIRQAGAAGAALVLLALWRLVRRP